MSKQIELPVEVATIKDLAIDGVERHENSLIENVPKELSLKGVVAIRMFMNFMDNDTINEYTGKKTFLDIEESYLVSGVYDDEHLSKVYKVEEKEREVRDKSGSTFIEYYNVYSVINRREDLRLRAEALRYWNDNHLNVHYKEMQELKRGNIPFEDLLAYAIQKDALKEGDTANRRMAIDIHGMKNKKSSNTINVYIDGGGDKLNREITKSTGNDNYDLGIIDIDVDDNPSDDDE